MSVRTRIIRRMRKNILRAGKITRVEYVDRDFDGTKFNKKDCGYSIKIIVNGWHCTSLGDTLYEA